MSIDPVIADLNHYIDSIDMTEAEEREMEKQEREDAEIHRERELEKLLSISGFMSGEITDLEDVPNALAAFIHDRARQKLGYEKTGFKDSLKLLVKEIDAAIETYCEI